MISNKQLLCSLLHTARQEQAGIRASLAGTMGPGLRSALEAQLREYDTLERECCAIACQRGWELPEVDPARQMLSGVLHRVRTDIRRSDGRLSAALIREHTNGMIRSLQDLHRAEDPDRGLRTLSQKLLDCQTAGIRQLQQYL